MKLDGIAGNCPEWLRGVGPHSDIVMSSRVRLARNLAEYPFVRKCTEKDRIEIETAIKGAISKVEDWHRHDYVDVNHLPPLDRQFLVERQLISRELADGQGSRASLIGADETFSIMVNEEDHVRMQVMRSGLDLETSWENINQIDDRLERHANFAFHQRLGYLTACPTNVGTGMRVSVMLHLPALVMIRHSERVFRGLQKISITVRGLYGEGSQAMGDFYQISNRITLGKSEEELIRQVSSVIPDIISYERRAREFLLREGKKDLHDRVSRAYGLLCNAQTISSEETMHLLSSVRMGVNLGLITNVEISTINKLFIHTQPAHLQKLRGAELDTPERNLERAKFLQRHLRNDHDGASEN